MLEQITNDYDFICKKWNIPEIRYKIDVAPHSAPRMNRSDKWKKRDVVLSYFAFKDELRLKCNLLGYELEEVLDIAFIVPMSKSWSKKKKREMLYSKHQDKPDRDNFLKAFQDAFGVDDSFVYDGRTLKIWGVKPEILIF